MTDKVKESSLKISTTLKNFNSDNFADISPGIASSLSYLSKFSYEIKDPSLKSNYLLLYEELLQDDSFYAYFCSLIEHVKDIIAEKPLKVEVSDSIMSFRYIYMMLWNITDESVSLCKRLREKNLQSRLIIFLNNDELFLLVNSSTLFFRMIQSFIGILSNIIHKEPSVKYEYREMRLISVLIKYLETLDVKVTEEKEENGSLILSVSILLLTLELLNENKQECLTYLQNIEPKARLLLKILHSTLETNAEFFSKLYGFKSLEVIVGLRNLASKSIKFKETLLQLNILNDIDDVIKSIISTTISTVTKELANATLNLLYTLFFHFDPSPDSTVPNMHFDAELIKSLPNYPIMERLLELEKTSTQLECNNLLSRIFDLLKLKDLDRTKKRKHVMISYSHKTKDKMIKVRDHLLNLGFEVWMDIDHQFGQFIENITRAIQESFLIVIGMCQAYAESNYCKQEVFYAFELKVDFLPIKLEENFVPKHTDWLGLPMAGNIIHDLYENHPNMSMKQQVDAIGKAVIEKSGKIAGVYKRNFSSSWEDYDPSNKMPSDSVYSNSISELSHCFLGRRSHADHVWMPSTLKGFENWTNGELNLWLSENGFEKLGEHFINVNGSAFKHLYWLKIYAPETYARYLEHRLQLPLNDFLNFNLILDKLFKE
ncbi:hypothetical protein Ciccas_004415 [Cichlidogyrus casuarinus]|uniref:TIR domain-containing protein n=1 Tax=Cichlidogyrus casuarinus TaxID=1844966 RepID=A0ABD2QBM4_9PLAT